MKIGIISSTILTCPPRTPTGEIGYGGLEQLAWQHAIGPADKGHEVNLIAPTGSIVDSRLTYHFTSLGESEKQAYSGYWQKLLSFDCIIDHSWQKWSMMLKMEGRLTIPVLLWLHAPVDTMFQSKPPIDKPCFVAISQDQANHTKEHLNCEAKLCYNGVDHHFYNRISEIKRSDNYLFLARFSSIKGPDLAISAAKESNVNLDMVGDDTITGEPSLSMYIQEQCTLSPKLRYIGPQSRSQCNLWFNRNKALIHPNMRYREPFGLAPVEAQLCGMPVIAWDYGAMRETIRHGETGFLVKSQEELVELLKTDAVSTIDPLNCTAWAMEFSYTNMINRVNELCHEAVETGGW